MSISDFIPPIVGLAYRRLRRKKVKTNYKIGSCEIEIPSDHDLPRFQSKWRLYDRFLPVLVKYIDADRSVVDVGANIGDTAIALLQNCSNQVKCIEPSDIFYPVLERNLKKWTSGSVIPRVTLIKKVVGTGGIEGSLHHTKGGSARLVHGEDENAIKVTPLDFLVDQVSETGLIKVDTDGYDFDVLLSAKEIIAKSKPILFWENFISDEFQLDGYRDLYIRGVQLHLDI